MALMLIDRPDDNGRPDEWHARQPALLGGPAQARGAAAAALAIYEENGDVQPTR